VDIGGVAAYRQRAGAQDQEAGEIEMKFTIAIEPGTKKTAFGIAVPDLPGCFNAGDTVAMLCGAGQRTLSRHRLFMRRNQGVWSAANAAGPCSLWSNQRISSFQIAEAREVTIRAQQLAHAVLNTQCCDPSIVYARPEDFASL